MVQDEQSETKCSKCYKCTLRKFFCGVYSLVPRPPLFAPPSGIDWLQCSIQTTPGIFDRILNLPLESIRPARRLGIPEFQSFFTPPLEKTYRHLVHSRHSLGSRFFREGQSTPSFWLVQTSAESDEGNTAAQLPTKFTNGLKGTLQRSFTEHPGLSWVQAVLAS